MSISHMSGYTAITLKDRYAFLFLRACSRSIKIATMSRCGIARRFIVSLEIIAYIFINRKSMWRQNAAGEVY